MAKSSRFYSDPGFPTIELSCYKNFAQKLWREKGVLLAQLTVTNSGGGGGPNRSPSRANYRYLSEMQWKGTPCWFSPLVSSLHLVVFIRVWPDYYSTTRRRTAAAPAAAVAVINEFSTPPPFSATSQVSRTQPPFSPHFREKIIT